ncbi:hypothetical protein XH99_11035 [Bradyrhizobium nanningense]|uniref:Methyltransferase domain-containing protein n=1 Tax=Bradyrhizobium nanningense TaxID=1325118 RepID=A0A4Q0S6Y8_9BRAD|nr:hypothetical protein [Bradyrhizobium nanningense]RXH31127.1 hypothetical protein XH99_11035 [Bradyrhizobium nanningense]
MSVLRGIASTIYRISLPSLIIEQLGIECYEESSEPMVNFIGNQLAILTRQAILRLMNTPTEKPLPNYKEPTKIAVREQALGHAVELLTSRRECAAVVPEDHVGRVRASLLTSDTAGYQHAGESCSDDDIESWKTFRSNTLGSRNAEELTVAYLAGPQPSNDLVALVELGLRPENIWAFEIGPDEISQGLADLDALGLRGVKFIPVSIDEYFVGTPRRFDIIYIDACGPLPSDSQKTTRLLVDIFKHGALAPLGILITNFSRPDISNASALDTYAHLIASYLYPKGFMESETGGMIEGPEVHGYLLENPDEPTDCFLTEVKNNFERHYGAFITRHILDIASIIAPTARLTGSNLYRVLYDPDIGKAVNRGRRFARFKPELFEEPDEKEDSSNTAEGPSELLSGVSPEADYETDGDAVVHPDLFSLVWTMAACGLYEVGPDFLPPTEKVKKFVARWRNQLVGSQQTKKSAEDLIAAFYAWRHDQSLWSPALKEIGKFPYRNLMPFLCDVPTEEIGYYAAFAQLAYPAHANNDETRRFRYLAEGKSTPMFMDVIPFDECRYVYDWLSAVHLVPNDWFDLSAQLTFRFALDAIAKDLRWYGDDFLYGCHVVGISSVFPASELAKRVDLSPTSNLIG